MRNAIVALCAACTLQACAADPLPDTSYYRLAIPTATPEAASGPTLAVEEFSVDEAYDDTRIAYRTSPYQLQYYEYHRWASDPGTLVANSLGSAYANTGEFERVARGFDDTAPVVLGGHVSALEEVDETKQRWVARVVVDLELRDAETDEVLWTRRIEEREPLEKRHPEGLAAATSEVLQRIAKATADEVAAQAQTVVAARSP